MSLSFYFEKKKSCDPMLRLEFGVFINNKAVFTHTGCQQGQDMYVVLLVSLQNILFKSSYCFSLLKEHEFQGVFTRVFISAFARLPAACEQNWKQSRPFRDLDGSLIHSLLLTGLEIFYYCYYCY